MNDDRIVASSLYGQHIALTCVNHPTLRWSTKNIAPIGARSIFYNLENVNGMGPECQCSIRSLLPVEQHPIDEQDTMVRDDTSSLQGTE